tara:strand:+ start:2885 stop:3106 length:222 start_codon:yes stop_codon:yes gene_type:complete
MEKPKKSLLQTYEENPLARAFLGMPLLIGSLVCIALIMSQNVGHYEKQIKDNKQTTPRHKCQCHNENLNQYND